MVRRFKPTDEHRKQVDTMTACGISVEMVARVLGVRPTTLRKYFRTELDTAHVKANCAVAQSLFERATGTGPQSVTAAIFWLKARAGWREASVAAAPPLGKKELAAEVARTAADKTDWSRDLAVSDEARPN